MTPTTMWSRMVSSFHREEELEEGMSFSFRFFHSSFSSCVTVE